MVFLLGLSVISLSILVLLLDKLVEHYSPEGNLSKVSEEIDEMMVSFGDYTNNHNKYINKK